MDYVKRKKRIKNIYRISEPYTVAVNHTIPAITAKAAYKLFTDKMNDYPYFGRFYIDMERKPKFIWNYFGSTAILGIMTSSVPPVDRVHYNGILFSTETPPVSVTPLVYPMSLYSVIGEDKAYWRDVLKLRKEYDNNVIENLVKYTKAYHSAYMNILRHYDYFDFTLITYHMDRFTHQLRGAQLLKQYEMCDTLLGEVLDNVDTKNIIAFSDHGADHKKEAIIADSVGLRKLTHFNEIPKYIQEVWREIA